MPREFRIMQCTAYSNQRPGSSPKTHISSPGFNVTVETRVCSKKRSHLFELLTLCNNRTDTNRSAYPNKVKQSRIKACSSFAKLFSHI